MHTMFFKKSCNIVDSIRYEKQQNDAELDRKNFRSL